MWSLFWHHTDHAFCFSFTKTTKHRFLGDKRNRSYPRELLSAGAFKTIQITVRRWDPAGKFSHMLSRGGSLPSGFTCWLKADSQSPEHHITLHKQEKARTIPACSQLLPLNLCKILLTAESKLVATETLSEVFPVQKNNPQTRPLTWEMQTSTHLMNELLLHYQFKDSSTASECSNLLPPLILVIQLLACLSPVCKHFVESILLQPWPKNEQSFWQSKSSSSSRLSSIFPQLAKYLTNTAYCC